MYFNWTLALARPVFPFFLYTFVLLNLAALLGLWPEARIFATAVLVPMLGYTLMVWLGARGLWARHPDLREPQSYTFGEASYLVEAGGRRTPVHFRDVTGLESRRAFYLLREEGSADILPKRSLDDEAALRAFLEERVAWKRSSFL